jgi:hypothetical protein
VAASRLPCPRDCKLLCIAVRLCASLFTYEINFLLRLRDSLPVCLRARSSNSPWVATVRLHTDSGPRSSRRAAIVVPTIPAPHSCSPTFPNRCPFPQHSHTSSRWRRTAPRQESARVPRCASRAACETRAASKQPLHQHCAAQSEEHYGSAATSDCARRSTSAGSLGPTRRTTAAADPRTMPPTPVSQQCVNACARGPRESAARRAAPAARPVVHTGVFDAGVSQTADSAAGSRGRAEGFGRTVFAWVACCALRYRVTQARRGAEKCCCAAGRSRAPLWFHCDSDCWRPSHSSF